MTGTLGPSTAVNEKFLMALSLAFALFLVIGIGTVAYTVGHSEGRLEAWTAEKRNCIKRENRQFVDQGFLFFSGSGEVTTREVCVEWNITR